MTTRAAARHPAHPAADRDAQDEPGGVDGGVVHPDEIGVSPSPSQKFAHISVPFGSLVRGHVRRNPRGGPPSSSDPTTQSFMREIPQCWMTGQAAGVAAALAVRRAAHRVSSTWSSCRPSCAARTCICRSALPRRARSSRARDTALRVDSDVIERSCQWPETAWGVYGSFEPLDLRFRQLQLLGGERILDVRDLGRADDRRGSRPDGGAATRGRSGRSGRPAPKRPRRVDRPPPSRSPVVE